MRVIIGGMGLVGDLLERAARATPATVEDRASGWWLRHTDNGTWWSGAALAHGAADNLALRVDAAERFYAKHGAVARFQVCGDCPGALDGTLAGRGYRRESAMSLLTGDAGACRLADTASAMTARVDATLTPDWLVVLNATSASATDVEHETRVLRELRRPQAYVTVLAGAEPVGIGRAVAEDGWTGVFSMVTVASARRRGAARLVLAAVAGWAEAHRAPRLYLQVERSNGAARRLYDAAGFRRVATYHYRVRATDTTG